MKELYKKELYDKNSLGLRPSKMKDSDGHIILEIDPKHFDRLEKEKQETVKFYNAKPRSCGDCNLCCKFPPVPRLEKKAYELCKNCDIGVGCKTYNDRPIDCKAFDCFWVMGIIPEEYKPNKVGFYITANSPNDLALGMLKVYTEPHRVSATIKKLKQYQVKEEKAPQGFHIKYGPGKKDSWYLHVNYGIRGEYGVISHQELEKQLAPVIKKLPKKTLQKLKETF